MAYGTQTDAPEPIAFRTLSPTYKTETGTCDGYRIDLRDPLGDVSEIKISLPMPEGMDFSARSAALKASDECSPTWWRLMSTWPGSTNEQGYFATVEDGKRLIELARRTVEIPAIDALLTSAGFAHEHTLDNGARFYRRSVGRHFFTIVIQETSVHLMFERDRAGHHRNLMRLSTALEGHDSQTIPCFWPPYLEAQAMHVLLACSFADEYEAAGRTAAERKTRRSRAA
jgi:hypothetical protein